LRLKKLEIFGFKSFPDKTVLRFDTGITGIVGPNGCGKSNVSDAFRWVFGEQSAKSMRGGKMPDVIFAGTSQRKPLGMAEVTITLTDVGESLPVDYEEVAVTRRLHRSGESEYFLNRQPIRLKDLHSLFLDSGVGKNSFAIMEQGKVDQVINLSPKDRRSIFEEAAGILRFLQRKREALRRLEQTQNNRSRVSDIHDEVERQIQVLERQAKEARLFKEKQGTLEHLEKALFVAKWQRCQQSYTKASARDEELQMQLEKDTAADEEQRRQLVEAKNALEEEEKELKVRSEAVFKARGDKELRAQEKQSQQSRIKEAARKKKELDEEIKGLREERKNHQSEHRQNGQQYRQFQKQLDKVEKDLQTQRKKVLFLDEDVTKVRGQQYQARQRQLETVQDSHRIVGEIKEKTIRQESERDSVAMLRLRHEELSQVISSTKEEVESKKRQVKDAIAVVEKKKQVFTTLEQQQAKIAGQLQNLEQKQEGMTRTHAEAEARQKVLMHLREEMEGMSSGSKRILNEASKSKSPLHNKVRPLYECLAIDDGNKGAMVALRSYTQTLVVKTQKELKAVLDFAKSEKIKDFSLLCLEHLSTAGNTDDQLTAAFFKGMISAPEIFTALKLLEKAPQQEAWCNDGFFVDRRRVIFSSMEGENNLFRREAELKTLDKSITVTQQQLQKINEEIRVLDEEREVLHRKRLELDQEIRREEMSLVEVNFGFQQATERQKEALNEQKNISVELKEKVTIDKALTATLKELAKQQALMEKKLGQVQQETLALDQEINAKERDFKEQQSTLQSAEEAFRLLSQEQQRRLHALEVLEVRIEESVQHEKRLEQEVEEILARQEIVKAEQEESQHALGDVEKAITVATESCRKLERSVIEKKRHIIRLEGMIGKMRSKVQEMEKERVHLDAKLQQLKADSELLEGDIKERYDITMEEACALELTLDDTITNVEKKVNALRRSVEQSSDINMTSIEEFEKYKVRYQFLNEQMEDLKGSEEELMEIIGKLDDESRQIFGQVFEQIRQNFLKNFGILFKGGEADLRFTESNDILEAGVEIVAKPPGKQMRSINLLSGGEKCLTAVALLFAIFEVKSAPFCILDEIDAPLDDSNVERFLNVVKQFVDRCQFIIITHNKRTMAIADQLLGVSMQEKGVSKILTVRFNSDAEAKREVALVGAE